MINPSGPTSMSVGQLFNFKKFHTSKWQSFTTACLTSYLKTADLNMYRASSLSNFALWHPIKATSGTSLKVCSSFSSSAMTCMQLIQQDVQKSMTTNFPLRLVLKLSFWPSLVFSQFNGPFKVSSAGKSKRQGSFWFLSLCLIIDFRHCPYSHLSLWILLSL